MYLSLRKGNFILKQPNEIFFSYNLFGTRMFIGINESAESILAHLNGENTEEDIVNSLCKKYDEPQSVVKYFVSEFIEDLRVNDILVELDQPSINIIKNGSDEYYTPEHVTIELTHKCPLYCKHCFLDAGNGQEINNEKCYHLVSELLRIGVRIFQLTGGEPFSFRQIDSIINLLSNNYATIHISTSGYILSKKVKLCLDELSKSIDPLIQVSIDGMETTHNDIRGKKDAYEKALKFIKYTVNKKIPTVVSTILIKQSLLELELLANTVKDLGVDELRLGILTNQGRAEENVLEGYTYTDYKRTLSYLKSKFNSANFAITETEEEINNAKSCGAGYKTIKITPSLMVTPCAMMPVNIGNLNIESLESILERSYNTFSSLKSPSTLFCSTCSEENYCKGCISEAIIRKDTVRICSWETSQKDILCTINSTN